VKRERNQQDATNLMFIIKQSNSNLHSAHSSRPRSTQPLPSQPNFHSAHSIEHV